jgi:hypothetical protein
MRTSRSANPIITASAGAGGSISPSGSVSVPYGTNQAFSITAAPCYSIADVIVDGSSVGAVSSYTFNNVTLDHTITASFSLNQYTINASAGSGGTITPNGNVLVNCGSDQAFAIRGGRVPQHPAIVAWTARPSAR